MGSITRSRAAAKISAMQPDLNPQNSLVTWTKPHSAQAQAFERVSGGASKEMIPSQTG